MMLISRDVLVEDIILIILILIILILIIILNLIMLTCSSFLGSLGTRGWGLRSMSIVGVNTVVIDTCSFYRRIILLIVKDTYHIFLPQWFLEPSTVPVLASLEDTEGCKISKVIKNQCCIESGVGIFTK